MIRRAATIAAVLHVAFAAFWVLLPERREAGFEESAVNVTGFVALTFYVVLIIAFWKAQKTRLNVALAIQKFYWALFVAYVLLSRFDVWIAPPWARVYIWIGISLSIVGVLYEFWRANWGPGSRGNDGAQP